MKVVHRNKEHPGTVHDWQTKAGSHEREGELAEATVAYEKLVKLDPLNTKALNRLMMLYRQLKEYKKELTVINTAIAAFEKNYREKQPVYNKKITALSKALLKATGLGDKKGNNLYQPGELTRWKKRKATVMKKLGK